MGPTDLETLQGPNQWRGLAPLLRDGKDLQPSSQTRKPA